MTRYQEREQERNSNAEHDALGLDREPRVQPEDPGGDDQQGNRDRRGMREPATRDHGVTSRIRKLPPHR